MALLQINYVVGVFNGFENSLNLILMSILMRDVLIKITLIFINVCGLLLPHPHPHPHSQPPLSCYLYCYVYAFCNTDKTNADEHVLITGCCLQKGTFIAVVYYHKNNTCIVVVRCCPTEAAVNCRTGVRSWFLCKYARGLDILLNC